MDTQQITLDRGKAKQLWRDYKTHQHYSTPIDDEVRRTYLAIAQGRVVIKALESITAAGLNAEGLPKLAIARAGAAFCYLRPEHDGSAVFADDERAARWRDDLTRHRIVFPRNSFPGINTHRWMPRAVVPQVPLSLRPKRGLANYHMLWEAEWEMVPPVDPMLLRRIGRGDLWVMCAAWELTAVERAALAARVHA